MLLSSPQDLVLLLIRHATSPLAFWFFNYTETKVKYSVMWGLSHASKSVIVSVLTLMLGDFAIPLLKAIIPEFSNIKF